MPINWSSNYLSRVEVRSQMFYKTLAQVLPPRVSFRLRSWKANYIDSDLIELRNFLKVFSNSEENAIDIGANHGIYADVISRYFKRITAIEPNPNCVKYLRRILPSNCSIIETAVSNETGRIVLRVPVISGSLETTRATISLLNEFDGLSITDTKAIEVEMQSVDAMLQVGAFGSGKINFVKIDVEGHEYSVLQGARQLLATHQPALCIEVEQRHGTHIDATHKLLDALGYYRVHRTAKGYSTSEAGESERGSSDLCGRVNSYYITSNHFMQLQAVDL